MILHWPAVRSPFLRGLSLGECQCGVGVSVASFLGKTWAWARRQFGVPLPAEVMRTFVWGVVFIYYTHSVNGVAYQSL